MNIASHVRKVKRFRTKPKTKASAMVFRLKEPLAEFLRCEAQKSNKTMTAIVEELLTYRKQYKSWPPDIM